MKSEQNPPPLDLRETKCPLNFVKAKLALEKLPVGGTLEIWIRADGESAINIPQSFVQEGHAIVESENGPDALQRLLIRRMR